MKKIILPALEAAVLMLMLWGCCKKAGEPGYIGPSDIKIEDGRMSPEALLSFGRLTDPQLSPDGTKILYGVSYTSIKDNRNCRNLLMSDVDGSDVRRLTLSGKSVSNGRWAPDGRGIYFLCGGQLHYAAIGKKGTAGRWVKLSDVEGGMSEFSLSPDGSSIVYVSTVPSDVLAPSDFDPALDKARAYVTEDLMYRHWDHWVTELPHSYVAAIPGRGGLIVRENSIDILGGPQVKFELPTEPFGGLEQLSWSPDGKYIAYSCRKKSGKEYAFSTNTEIFVFCPSTGRTSIVAAGGGYDTDPAWSPDGRQLAWISMARDGYEADQQRLKVAELEFSPLDEAGGSGANPVVKAVRTLDFPFNVAGPVWKDGCIYFNALYSEGVQGIFRIDASEIGAGVAPECLTPGDLGHDYDSPFAVLDDGTVLASWCSMDFPTELVAIAADGTVGQISDENGHILRQIKEHVTERRFIKTVDGKDMLTWVLLPPDFDASKEYPAIEILLGGPQGTLSQSWSYRWNYCLMAHQGYVVVLPNRRGTTAFGQEWCEQISGDYPGLNMQDYLSAARAVKAEPYVGKLAACGASYGGYSVYYMAGVHEGIFDCFIAHAGIFDERYMYYETEEMWFPNWDNGGLEEYSFTPGETGPAGDGVTFGGIRQGGSPWSSLEKARRHYANSPAANVTRWKTPILCIHGMMDYRIPYDQGMAAFNSAQMMGVPSKLIVFPEENHWILKPQNALFWHRSYFDWLDRWCKEPSGE